MSRKIIDQYTDRADLTGQQKWVLRNPEKIKATQAAWQKSNPGKHASDQRVWRDKNPDAYEAINERRKKKLLLVRVQRNTTFAKGQVVAPRTKRQERLRNEILSLHGRGKSSADIAIWMNIPISAINSVIQQQTT